MPNDGRVHANLYGATRVVTRARNTGEVGERPNPTHSKCVVPQGTVGSNPTLSAIRAPCIRHDAVDITPFLERESLRERLTLQLRKPEGPPRIWFSPTQIRGDAILVLRREIAMLHCRENAWRLDREPDLPDP